MEPSSGSCSAGWPDSKGRCGTSSVGAAGMLVANGARAPSSGGGGRGATVGGWSSPREGRRGRGGGSRAAGIGRDPGRERMRILWSLLRGAAPRAGRIRRGGAARRVSEPRGCSLRMARARRARAAGGVARRLVGGHLHVKDAVAEAGVPAPLGLDVIPDGSGCGFYGAFFGELLRGLAGFEGAVRHVECRSRGDARCEWRARAELGRRGAWRDGWWVVIST